MSRHSVLVFLLLAAAAVSQETLTNEGVINLVKSGMSEDLIMNVIGKQPAAFALGSADLVGLKNAGVSERIITAMVNKAGGGAGGTATAGAPTSPFGGKPAVTDPGIYYRKNGEYFELLTEDVNWKTGGAMKSIASAGIIKKDLKGYITGISSRNFLQSPVEIVIAPPTGMSHNDYFLLPLTPAKGVREFMVGPVNQKSGVAKGALEFGVEKVGNNAFRLVFPTPLDPGEYGLLTAKSVGGVGGAASRMYTFRLR
jgi:hypothetical protein